jgi:hypothetical protein
VTESTNNVISLQNVALRRSLKILHYDTAVLWSTLRSA